MMLVPERATIGIALHPLDDIFARKNVGICICC